jgi:hypothetical protein
MEFVAMIFPFVYPQLFKTVHNRVFSKKVKLIIDASAFFRIIQKNMSKETKQKRARIALQIPTEWKEQLQAEATARRVSISDVIRGIILPTLEKTSEEANGGAR